MHFSAVFSALGLASLVSAHGVVLKPASRKPGDATTAACGRALVNFYKQDETSYPEAFLRSNPLPDRNKCNLFLCKGYQFGDNAANVQSYKTGDSVEYEVYIRIPHSGYANVSIVDTTSNKVLGTPLVSWASGYAASTRPPADQTKFSVKIPELGGQCATAGVCVLQWHWFGAGQTYQSCTDFTVAAPVPAPVEPAPEHGHGHRIRGQARW
ncbi:hypothetical protein QBC41DRAFT_337351 [Cercophora samala]|uniref:Chitin-binding type-4 domain-containing protein n=1 Tax=Cercophora samala TaxID=330535 RepID=A0AA40DA49_9PEZI|nr:hypothetical protein QBC41DRAFT_337351 [Cercophora samala]